MRRRSDKHRPRQLYGTRQARNRGIVTVRHDSARPASGGFASGPNRRFGVTACALALAALASGCSLPSLNSGTLFGGNKTESTPRSVTQESLLQAAKSDTDINTASTLGLGCPAFIISTADRHQTQYEGGRIGDGLAIIHQGEITRTARECDIEPGKITIKYGFSGRVLLGPRGTPGVVKLTFQVYLVDANQKRVETQPIVLDVAIPPDSPIAYFSTVRSISFVVPEGARPSDYRLVVAFDKPPADPPPKPQRTPPTAKKKS